ncbi:MAG: TIM barrel protein [Nanoarchaeota archaeon]|nr:TIM barrel protein [Nanoarchaeota archaeon]
MEEKRGYTISNIYQGGYSTMVPSYSGYITAGSLGMTTDPRTANIIQEVSSKLSSGVKNIEVEGVSADIFDSIPKQHLKEVNRLSKLTGVDISLHAPVMDVSGIDPRGGFSEVEREASERKVAETLKRAHEMNPDGNIPVNFHSAEGIPGSTFLPPSKRKEGEKYQRLIVVNRETGRLAPLEPEIEYLPGKEKIEPTRLAPEKRLDKFNTTEWDNSISQLILNRERFDEILQESKPLLQPLQDPNTGEIKVENPERLSKPAKEAFRHFRDAQDYLDNVYKVAYSNFSKAYEFGDEHQKNVLKKFSEDFAKKTENKPKDQFAFSEAMGEFLHNLKSQEVAPKMYVPIEKFAIEKSSETFGNAAWQAYKELKGKNVPILTIENPPAGFALSTGEDIRKIVEESRKQFVKKAAAEGFSESDARKEAEKLIGATWDVGHINMLRKFGYSEKEITEEAKHVAPILKHVHLSDNFGFEHTELPMGMGNVPIKEVMEKLGQKGYDARKIIEASGWWQHFRTPPFQETLEAVGSPIYGMKMAPYWSQAPGLYQGYFGGYGQMLPQINYETFGAGFSRLPAELGGQAPGAQGGRMSGRPME